MRFVSLHHHSTFSYRDGFGTPAEHVSRAADLGMSALALTEHGNTSSHVQLEKASLKAGIKPIFGCELYTAPDKTRQKWHLTVLAMNQIGLINLNKLVSRSSAEGFYQWPTVSGDMLFEHHEGLIVLSGCSDSLLSCTLLGGKSLGPKRETCSPWDLDECVNVVSRFIEVFGDRYYIETQQFPELDRTRILNPAFERIAVRTGVQVVATADVHYPLATDNEMQKILHAAGRGTGTVAEAEATWEYDIPLCHPLSDGMVIDRLTATGMSPRAASAAVAISAEIASRCEVILPKSEPISFPTNLGRTVENEMSYWIRQGWKFRLTTNKHFRENQVEYRRRVLYELKQIEAKGFVDYFLMVADVVRWAKSQNIFVGPGRGSVAGSLIAYLLRITEVDSMQFPVFFERFIDMSRSDFPDIDLDFEDERRDEIRTYCISKYGSNCVGNVGNFTRYRGKSSVNDVARVYRIPRWEIQPLLDRITDKGDGDARIFDSIIDAVESFPECADVIDKHPQLLHAMRLEGGYRGMSVHAAGIVVSNRPITDTCSLYTRPSGPAQRPTTVIAYDKRDAKYVGMLKLDLLGLSTLSMIKISLRNIGMSLEDLYSIPLNDPQTFKAFQNNDVVGVFQFDGRAARNLCGEIKPDNFMHLSDICALGRPGPLFSGMADQYVSVKTGVKVRGKLHPIVDNITDSTYGQIIYQEQVFRILKDLAGFSAARIGEIRRVIQDKLGVVNFNKMKEEFQRGAADLECVDADLSGKIWNFMVSSSGYSFNVAHSVAYAMITYWHMWLKAKYPLEFYLGVTSKIDASKIPRILKDAQRHGIKALSPDIEKSSLSWTISDNNSLLAGFSQIPGIADNVGSRIILSRDACPENYSAWSDLERITGIGPKTVQKISSFCTKEDPFKINFARDTIAKFIGTYHVTGNVTSDQLSKMTDCEIIWVGLVKKIKFKNHLESLRSMSDKTDEEILSEISDPHLLDRAVMECYDSGDEEVFVRFSRWKYPRFKDVIKLIDLDCDIIMVKGRLSKNFGIGINCDSISVIEVPQ